MKRLKSNDDLESYREKCTVKDWGRREEDSGFNRSSSSLHRNSHYKSSDSGRKIISSAGSSRYERLEDDRESSRLKRLDYGVDTSDRRKSYDRQRDGKEIGILSSSPRAGYGMDNNKIYRSESFSGPRRDFPKGFRSERDRSRRDASITSWRRYGDDVARSGSEVGRGNRMGSEELGKAVSPPVLRDAKSPAWSKDSGSEQSKSIEVKKYGDKFVEHGGPSTEREEGELEPDPQPHMRLDEPVVKDEAVEKQNLTQNELKSLANGSVWQEKEGSRLIEMGDSIKISSSEELTEGGTSKMVVNKNENLQVSQDTPESERAGETECGNDVEGRKENHFEGEGEEEDGGSFDDNLSSLQEKKEAKGMDLEIMKDTGNVGGTGISEIPLMEEMSQTWKGKGKSVPVLPFSSVHFAETNLEVEYKPRDLLTGGDIEMEGPYTRGFQFLSSDPIKKQERDEQLNQTKPKDEKLALDLSLSLPNVLLPIGGSRNMGHTPGSPSHAGSVQSFPSSFRTNSESFMPSMSYSGSQQFTHNPSCSLTTNNYDFEQSVKSKPLFQGVDWKALSSDENKNKEITSSSRGNGYYQSSQVSQENSNGQAPRVTEGGSKELIGLERQLSFNKPLSGKQHVGQAQVSQENSNGQAPRVTEGGSKKLIGLERQLSFNKPLSGKQHVVSYENAAESFRDRRQASTQKDESGLRRSFDANRKEEILAFGAEFSESIVTMIVSEHLHTMTLRFSDMAKQNIACVKTFVLDIITNPDKHCQLSALQNALRKRSDTLDMLVNANHTQLEIMVGLKTGLKEFLLQKNEIRSSDLAEIFLNIRCRNLACRSLLPVDECDCKICAPRTGFCRECTCLVCSKFDNASNTCSWVGCDVCLHWCHADCGLQESHIRNGHCSAEMQFHCVACGHPSEMFGFVKEVFLNFLKEWTAKNLARELEYVMKIFSTSKDVRGKHLHEIAMRMLSKLGDRADFREVQNHIIRFFTEADSHKPTSFPVESRTDLPTKNQERSNDFDGSSQGATAWMKSAYPDKPTPLEATPINSLPQIRDLPTKDQEKSNGIVGSCQGPPDWLKSTYPDKPTPLGNIISGFENSRTDKYTINIDFHMNAQKEPAFDELESLVRIKHAEAKMFQTRADDARREAEALKIISVTKNERIEEEYSSRITKLRLAEAEEMRRQKLEELQDSERGYHEYFSMKMRMETDIKDLLLKMEATRRSLST